MNVPFFTQRASFARQAPRINELLDEAIDTGQFVDGPLVSRLELALQERTGARHVICVASGTDALTIALQAVGLEAGDRVVVPVYTFIASATAIVHAGGAPVFADIEAQTYGLDLDALAETAARGECAGVMPVHLFQHMTDMHRVCEIAEQHHLTVVEDSAEGIEMWQGARHAGRFGSAGVLSFFPTKTLGALGDAGAIVTDSDEVAALARMLRSHGQLEGERPYTWERVGWNSRMDDIQAAVLLARLEGLDREIDQRRTLAALYDEALEPMREWVSTPRPNPPEVSAPPYVYLIEAERRDELVEHLSRCGIGTEVYYPRPLHLQPCFSELGYSHGDFPVAEHAATRALALPLYPDLPPACVEEVCAELSRFYHAATAAVGSPA